MGCGLSTRLNPEDAATPIHGRISDIDSSAATGKNLDHGGGDDSVSSWQGKDAKLEGEKEEEESHHSDEALIFPRSPSFRVYCIDSSNSRNGFCDNFNDNESNANSIKNNGHDEDSTSKQEEKKEGKKREVRIVGLRNVMRKAMPRRKKNLINFGCYTSHAAYDKKSRTIDQ